MGQGRHSVKTSMKLATYGMCKKADGVTVCCQDIQHATGGLAEHLMNQEN